MRLILVSGLSGSGKSVALHMLEDAGFYCVDNIPAALLKPFISHTLRNNEAQYSRAAVGVDARNAAAEIETVPHLIEELKKSGIQCEIVFLLANDDELLRRFAETRRKHPISTDHVSLKEAIAIERRLLEPILNAADLVIDTSRMGVHDLRELISQRVEKRSAAPAVAAGGVLRLQERHPGRCGFRVRRARPAESLLGSCAARAHRPRRGRHPLPRSATQRAAAARRHPAVRGRANPRTPGREPPLPDRSPSAAPAGATARCIWPSASPSGSRRPIPSSPSATIRSARCAPSRTPDTRRHAVLLRRLMGTFLIC